MQNITLFNSVVQNTELLLKKPLSDSDEKPELLGCNISGSTIYIYLIRTSGLI